MLGEKIHCNKEQLQCKYQEGKKTFNSFQQETVLYVEYAQPLFSFIFCMCPYQALEKRFNHMHLKSDILGEGGE